MAKKRFYAVVKGRNQGVFEQSWDHVRQYVEGFPGAIFKAFNTRAEAMNWWTGTFRDMATDGSEQSTKRARPVANSHPRVPEPGLEPVRPKKLPRRNDDPNVVTEATVVLSSPMSSAGSFVTCADEHDQRAPDMTKEEPVDHPAIYSTLPDGVKSLDPVAERPTIPLTPEQDKILQMVLKGNNVFFTGPAGSGKSLVLAHIKYHLAKDNLAYAVTAPTGIAAVLIQGVTINSFFGLGTAEQGLQHYLRDRGDFSQMIRARMQETDVLIVDEISMVSPDLWEKADRVARYHRGSNNKMHPKPFGGLQVIVCGDFYQLPPVEREDSKSCLYCANPFGSKQERKYRDGKSFLDDSRLPGNDCYFPELIDDDKWLVCRGKNCQHRTNDSVRFVFQTETWQKLDLKSLVLFKVHRQSDQEWVDILNSIKHSDFTPQVGNYLRRLTRPLPTLPNGIRATNLYSHRVDVDAENKKGLSELPGEEYSVKSIDGGWYVPRTDESVAVDRSQLIPFNQIVGLPYNIYFNNLQATRELKLKMNAQVMLVSNLDVKNQLVNGSRGIIKGFQRYTLDKLLENGRSEKSSKAILKVFFDTKQKDGCVSIPLVSFSPLTTAASVQSGEPSAPRHPIPIFPVAWDSKQYVDEARSALLQRIQIPLVLAWATTIHKSQGMTLDYTTVDIRRSFAAGQSYVALSRSRSPEGLSVLLPYGSLSKVIMTDRKVELFTKLLTARLVGVSQESTAVPKTEERHTERKTNENETELLRAQGPVLSPPRQQNKRSVFKQSIGQFRAIPQTTNSVSTKPNGPRSSADSESRSSRSRAKQSRDKQHDPRPMISQTKNQGTGVEDAIYID